jgi:putative oxidoreductase
LYFEGKNMRDKLQGPCTLAGRILMAIVFLGSGLSKLSKFQATVLYVASKGVLFPEAALALAAAVKLLGAAFLIVGWRVFLVGILLAGYCVVTALVFHNFWAMPADQLLAQQVNFLKNMSIAGGFLMVAALGGGPWSWDARTSEAQEA